jgi:pyruvate dehydrogenase E2 component (dihydrolipoamide acetyltransferase)
MAIEVTMPKFGLTMQEGTVQRYFKAPGEPIRAGEPLYEVETEKVMYEVEAPAAGTLALWLAGEGETVACGGLVAVIAEAGEDARVLASRYNTDRAPTPASPAVIAAPPATDTSAGDGAARRAISPVARKLAAELGVELARVTGTGPGGRITREDIERAAAGGASTGVGREAASASAGADTVRQPAVAAPAGAQAGARTIPLRGMRKTIATRMHQSLRDSAQLTISTDADVTAATEMRARRSSREFEFTYTDMLIQAVARALPRHPRMNSRITDDAILMLPEINVGMAVALDEGLIVPVIRGADRKDLREIAAITKDLGERARAGKLGLNDVTGGTFTVTNLGTWGVDVFTPILNPGETGILGIGRIVEKPAVYRGEIARRSMLVLSLTFDHRVIDGAPAAAFLQTVVEVFNYGDR